jgi:hypothetical protein
LKIILKYLLNVEMFQYQLVNREAPKLLSMPGLVDSHSLRQVKAVEVPKVNPEQPAPKAEVSEEAPKKKLGRPRKVVEPPTESSEAPVKTEKGKKKLDISKSKIY